MLLSTAIWVGLLGSFHCLGMCAPITWAIPDNHEGRRKWLATKLIYNIGRILTYGLLGALVGLAGEMLSFAGLQQWLSISVGIVLVLCVLFFGGVPEAPPLKPLRSVVVWTKTKMGKLLMKKGLIANFSLGLVNGLLPCGLVYTALIAAISMGDVAGGALYMILFGVGTLPMMIGAAILGKTAGHAFRQKVIGFTPKLIFMVGLLFIFRGLNLGIPYISPQLSDRGQIIECSAAPSDFLDTSLTQEEIMPE